MRQHPHIAHLYVTEDGRVLEELAPTKDGAGYLGVHARDKGKKRSFMRIHRLLAETYLDGDGPVVRHLDGNPTNNDLKNLAWGTQAENMQDSVEHGTTTKGEKNRHAKLTTGEVKEIKALLSDGVSKARIAIDYGVSKSAIWDIHYGRTWNE